MPTDCKNDMRVLSALEEMYNLILPKSLKNPPKYFEYNDFGAALNVSSLKEVPIMI